MQKRNSLLHISFMFVTLTMMAAFAASALPKSEYDVFAGNCFRSVKIVKKCLSSSLVCAIMNGMLWVESVSVYGIINENRYRTDMK